MRKLLWFNVLPMAQKESFASHANLVAQSKLLNANGPLVAVLSGKNGVDFMQNMKIRL